MKKITLLFVLLTFSVGYSQDPATGPTDPIARNAWDVKSIYNGIASPVPPQYTNEPNGDFQNFGGSNIVGPITLGDGNTVMKYTNHLYSGIQAGAGNLDVTTMTTLHLDVYSPGFTAFRIKLEAVNGTNVELDVPGAHVQGSWNSFDLDLSTYAGVDLAHLKWIVPVSYTPPGETLYIDNVYFYRPATAGPSPTFNPWSIPDTPTGAADFPIPPATSNSTGAITYTSSNTSVATIIGNTTIHIVGAGVTTITANQAAAAPYLAGSTTTTLTVAAPIPAAPTPPNRNPADVISLFSNAYSNITIDTWSASWDDSSYQDVLLDGNDTKKITFTNFIGVDFSGAGHHQDLSQMTNFHMDFYTDNTNLVGKVFNSKISQWNGGAGEASAAELNINTGTSPAIVSGAWVSIDVPMTQWVNNLTRYDIAQFLITSNLGVVYVDNIYFYKGLPLSTSNFLTTTFNAYPNPTQNSWKVKASNNAIISSIQVFDVLGKNVLSLNPNTNEEVTIDANQLNSGLYFAKINTDNGSSNIKLIKN